MVTRFVCAAIALAVAGCELLVSIPSASVAPDGPGGCVTGEPCSAPTPVCELSTGVCVECAVADECSAERPVCDSNACRACREDAECASNVCLHDGTCAVASRILHASPAGTGTECTTAMPCALETAVGLVTPTTDVVKLAPDVYIRTAPLMVAAPTVLSGHGAILRSMLGNLQVMIAITGVEATVIGIQTEGTTQVNVSCDGGKVRLHRTRFLGGAIGAYGQCEFVVERATVSNQTYYAFSMTNGPISIANSYLTRNGGSTTIGGVYLFNVTGGAIEHTTIADNLTNNGNGSFGGLRCMNSPTVVIRNSVVFGNEAPSIQATCTVSSSVIDPGYTGPGVNNALIDPMFVSPLTNDYHLAPGSPARELGDPTSMLGVDADGEPRPQPAGSAPDPGADEIL